MPSEVRTFDVTIPSGTPIATPHTATMSFPPRKVDAIELMFPSGLNGLVGVQIGSSGAQIIPHDIGTWIIANRETVRFDVVGAIDSGAWEFFGYNLGDFSHTIYVRFYLSQVVAGSGSGAVQPISF